MGEGHAGEDEAQPPHHSGQFDEQVGGLAEHQVHVDGQVEAPVVLHLRLEGQLLGAGGGQRLPLGAVGLPGGRGHHGPHEPDGLDEGHRLAQEHVPQAQPLQQAPRRLGLQQLLELHLDLLGDPAAGQRGVPQLPEQEQDDGVEKVAGLLGRRGRGLAALGRPAGGLLSPAAAIEVLPQGQARHRLDVAEAVVRAGRLVRRRLGLSAVQQQELGEQREEGAQHGRHQDHKQQPHPAAAARAAGTPTPAPTAPLSSRHRPHCLHLEDMGRQGRGERLPGPRPGLGPARCGA